MQSKEVSASKDKEKNRQDLKGTLVSVSILGAILIISWVGAYILFISR
ncbi:cytochrome c oxidase subunit 2A [Ornithinibacillus xuwenensis]|jgi:Cytochrome c oxidase subunit IIa family|uniref:Cytochrome c oxidase subunit 2A n=1 Tax=Ornithinibacillus xuwenensis TaxID=3144668 RepID=A0ABU9XD78_9BACI